MRRYRYSACRETLLPEFCPDAGTARMTGHRTAFPGCAAKDLCAEPFRISSVHPPGRPFSQNPPHTHPDSIACNAMPPNSTQITGHGRMPQVRYLLQHFIPVGGFVDSICRTNLPDTPPHYRCGLFTYHCEWASPVQRPWAASLFSRVSHLRKKSGCRKNTGGRKAPTE